MNYAKRFFDGGNWLRDLPQFMEGYTACENGESIDDNPYDDDKSAIGMLHGLTWSYGFYVAIDDRNSD